MTWVVINTETGEASEMEELAFLNTDGLSPEDQRILAEGVADADIADIARRHGRDLYETMKSSGFGDLSYSNAVAYSPMALRDEAEIMYETGRFIYAKDELKWAASKASNEQLREIGAMILEADSAWDGYRKEFVEALILWTDLNKDRL